MARIPGKERDRWYCKYCGFPCLEGRDAVGDFGVGGWSFVDKNLDLTLGTKVDYDGYFTVTETSVVASALPRNVTAYLVSDNGRNFYDVDSKDYEFKFDLNVASADVLAWGGCFLLSNVVDDVKAIIDASGDFIDCHVYRTAGGTVRIIVDEVISGSTTATDSLDISASTDYYATATIDASAETFTVELFSDSARSTSVGSASITLTVTTKAYRYFMPIVSYNDSTAPDLTYTISNYQIPNAQLTGIKDKPGGGCPFCGSKNWR